MDLLGCGDVTGGSPSRERGRPARTTLAQPHPSLPPGSTGNGATIPLQPSPWGSRRQGGRAPHRGKLSGHPTQRMRARRPRSRRGASSHPSCSARRHCPCRCGSAVPLDAPSSSFVSSGNRQLRRTTNEHEYQWSCLAAATSREEGPAGSAGVPPAQFWQGLAHFLHPARPANRIPLRPSPWGSRRQGGQAPHHGKTERPPNAENAGETPALPEGRLLPSFLLHQEAQPLSMRQSRPA